MDPRIILAKLNGLWQRSVVGSWPIGPWQARTADHLAPGEYRYDSDWAPIEGDTLWPATKTLFLRTEAKAPDAPAGDLAIAWSIEALEGLMSIDGRPYAGVDANHLRAVVPGGRALRLEAEFICVPRALCQPELRAERARLRGVSFVQVDRDVEAAYYDLRFAAEAAREARDERRRQLLDAAVEEALLAIDLTAPPERFRHEAAEARRILAERVGAIAPDPEAGRIVLTGHSHIDTAWLWPLRETVRKCGRTFSTACRLMERFPEYRFSCSQPQLYQYTRAHYPALYEEIKHWVREGRWECTGGMWVEPDCNVPSGEALIRQVLHGVRFFQEEFGRRPRSCWLPDVFGYPASLPQILKGCGLDYFYTNKLHWQSKNPFPAHLFWWEGVDGSRVLAHIPRLKRYYNGAPTPEEMNAAWENVLRQADYPTLLLPFGFGDGGGGPTEEMLEFAARAADFPGVPASRQDVEEAFYDGVIADAPDLPTWVGELYLETHRGTYTTQGAIKRANRKNELALRDAEICGVWAGLLGAPPDLAPLREAWETLLLLQFHDILPGSSIGQVYAEAAEDHARIARTATSVRDDALSAVVAEAGGADLVAVNTLSWPRQDVAEATIPAPAGEVEIVSADGREWPAQVLSRDGGRARIAFSAEVPALGVAGFAVRPAAAPAEHTLRAAPDCLENSMFRLEISPVGAITRLLDKRVGREVVPPGEIANDLQLLQDGPEREAAWNVHDTMDKRRYAWDEGATVEVVERGPVRAAVRVTRTFRESRLVQDIVLYDRLPRVDFFTRVDWQERQVLLKAAFPVAVRSARATYEVQFGAVERPTHRNTSWDASKFEVSAHHWADLSEAGYGVSLLNDCKYGYDAQGHVLRLTLLRGAEWPDPDADRGHHAFTYSLLPHPGGWDEGETVRRAWELNVPILTAAGGGRGEPAPARSFLSVEGPAILTACKPAEDGRGVILRLYEPHGGRGTVRVAAPRPLERVVACNLVEEDAEDVASEGSAFTFPIGPFQIRTFRVWWD